MSIDIPFFFDTSDRNAVGLRHSFRHLDVRNHFWSTRDVLYPAAACHAYKSFQRRRDEGRYRHGQKGWKPAYRDGDHTCACYWKRWYGGRAQARILAQHARLYWTIYGCSYVEDLRQTIDHVLVSSGPLGIPDLRYHAHLVSAILAVASGWPLC